MILRYWSVKGINNSGGMRSNHSGKEEASWAMSEDSGEMEEKDRGEMKLELGRSSSARVTCSIGVSDAKPDAHMLVCAALEKSFATSAFCSALVTSTRPQLTASQQHRNHGKRTKEAPEASVSAIALAARQAQRCLCAQGLARSAQAARLHAAHRLHSQPVRPYHPPIEKAGAQEIWKARLGRTIADIWCSHSLKYALNSRETKAIVMQRLIKVDGKVRTDPTYPAGFMDVIGIEKTGENFRLVYDTKGRFTVHRITTEEAEYKLGKVKRVQLGKGGIPFLVTHDART